MQTLRFILELLYFVSGALIAFFAAIGLRQLTIAKENAKMAAKREAFKLAAEQCAHYFADIMPLLDRLDTEIRNKKVELFSRAQVEVLGVPQVSFEFL